MTNTNIDQLIVMLRGVRMSRRDFARPTRAAPAQRRTNTGAVMAYGETLNHGRWVPGGPGPVLELPTRSRRPWAAS